MSLCMVLIPLMIKMAPVVGMIDMPDARKVHADPTPRVGGVGIVIGALVPIIIWAPWSDQTKSYLAGSLILLVFGVWDDIKELGHYVKFIGQLLAVGVVVYYGDLYVQNYPFIGANVVPESAARVFTVVAMVGMINAINHSDGLDGLAGGESLLSLGAIAYLSYIAGDFLMVLIAVATIGGVFGFLRFNSHPARVFMGDGGSQFLGFTLGFLAVYFTQISNPAVSPMLPLLILGLPIVDIIAVFIQRVYAGMNWFRATKNHIHHRLLQRGFYHHESVIFIYSAQALLVISGILFPYESDALLLSIYAAVSSVIFTFLLIAESRNWSLHGVRASLSGAGVGLPGRSSYNWEKLISFNRLLVAGILSLFLFLGAISATDVPTDIAAIAGVLAVLLLTRLVLGYRVWFLYMRLMVYVALAFIAYLYEFHPSAYVQQHYAAYYTIYGLLATAVVVAIKYSTDEFFQASPLDYLVVLVVMALAIVSEKGYANHSMVVMVVELIVLYYAAEVAIRYMKRRVNMFTLSTLASLSILTIRGIL